MRTLLISEFEKYFRMFLSECRKNNLILITKMVENLANLVTK